MTLSLKDQQETQADLDDTRRALAQAEDSVVLPGMEARHRERLDAYERHIARLEAELGE